MLLEDADISSTTFTRSSRTPQPSERRQSTRQLSTLRVAKLSAGPAQELCLIRNISAGGLMAHVYSAHDLGEEVVVELTDGEKIAGRIVWVQAPNVGVEFTSKIVLEAVLARTRSTEGRVARAPRLEVTTSATLKIGDGYHHAVVRDLSQSGVKIQFPTPFPAGTELVITIDGLGARNASVRWCRNGCCGLVFGNPIPFTRLTEWLEIRE